MKSMVNLPRQKSVKNPRHESGKTYSGLTVTDCLDLVKSPNKGSPEVPSLTESTPPGGVGVTNKYIVPRRICRRKTGVGKQFVIPDRSEAAHIRPFNKSHSGKVKIQC